MISIADLIGYVESKNGKKIKNLKMNGNEKLTFADLLIRIGPNVEKMPTDDLTLKSILSEGS